MDLDFSDIPIRSSGSDSLSFDDIPVKGAPPLPPERPTDLTPIDTLPSRPLPARPPLPPERPMALGVEIQPTQEMPPAQGLTGWGGQTDIGGDVRGIRGGKTARPAPLTGAAGEDVPLRTGGSVLAPLLGDITSSPGMDVAGEVAQREAAAEAGVKAAQERAQSIEAADAARAPLENDVDRLVRQQQERVGASEAQIAKRGITQAEDALAAARGAPGPTQTPTRSALEAGAAGLVGVPAGIVDNGFIALENLAKVTGRPEAAEQIANAGRSVQSAFESLATPDKARKGELGTQLGQGIGSTLGFGIAGLLGKALGLSEGATIALSGALPQASQQYREAEARGATASQKWYAWLTGLGIGASEALPLAGAFEKWEEATHGGLKKVLITALGQAFEEGAQEGGQQFGQNLAAGTPGLGWKPDQPLLEDVFGNAGIGALTGAIMAGGVGLGGLGANALSRGERALDELPAPPPVAPVTGLPPAPSGDVAEPASPPVGGPPPVEAAPAAKPKRNMQEAAPDIQETPTSMQPGAIPDDEVGVLKAAGMDVETIAEMSPRQRARAVQEARDNGFEPAPLSDEDRVTVSDTLADVTGSRERPVRTDNPADLEAAAARVNTEPTDAQKEAGNYKMLHAGFDGLDITIENPKGSTRSKGDWSVVMPGHYGYIKGTRGADGDKVDVLIGDKPANGKVFVVDQFDPKTGKFDEHKSIVGVDTAEEAAALYDQGFSDGSGPARRRGVTEMDTARFKKWLDKPGMRRRPVAKMNIPSKTPEPEPASAPAPEGLRTISSMPDHGRVVVFTETPPGSYLTAGKPYRVDRRGPADNDVSLQALDGSGGSYETADALLKSEWHYAPGETAAPAAPALAAEPEIIPPKKATAPLPRAADSFQGEKLSPTEISDGTLAAVTSATSSGVARVRATLKDEQRDELRRAGIEVDDSGAMSAADASELADEADRRKKKATYPQPIPDQLRAMQENGQNPFAGEEPSQEEIASLWDDAERLVRANLSNIQRAKQKIEAVDAGKYRENKDKIRKQALQDIRQARQDIVGRRRAMEDLFGFEAVDKRLPKTAAEDEDAAPTETAAPSTDEKITFDDIPAKAEEKPAKGIRRPGVKRKAAEKKEAAPAQAFDEAFDEALDEVAPEGPVVRADGGEKPKRERKPSKQERERIEEAKAREEAEKVRLDALPDDDEKLVAMARKAVDAFETAVQDGDQLSGAKIVQHVFDLIHKIQRGDRGWLVEGAPAQKILSAMSAKPGEVPKWLEIGTWKMVVDGVETWVTQNPVDGISGASLYATALDKPFISETGFRSLSGSGPANFRLYSTDTLEDSTKYIPRRVSVEDAWRSFLERQIAEIKKESKGKLYMPDVAYGLKGDSLKPVKVAGEYGASSKRKQEERDAKRAASETTGPDVRADEPQPTSYLDEDNLDAQGNPAHTLFREERAKELKKAEAAVARMKKRIERTEKEGKDPLVKGRQSPVDITLKYLRRDLEGLETDVRVTRGLMEKARSRTAGEAATSAVKNAGTAAEEAATALVKLFNSKARPGSGLTFDEETFAEAKPHFIAAAKAAKATVEDLADFIKALLRDLQAKGLTREGLEAMRPYVRRFVDDVRSGQISLSEAQDADSEGVRGPVSDLSSGQRPEDVPGATAVGELGGSHQDDRRASDGNVRDGGGPDAAKARGRSKRPRKADQGGEPDTVRGGRDRARPDRVSAETGPAGVKTPSERGRADAKKQIAERALKNYVITDADRIGEGGPKEKVRANIEAIRVLKDIQAENREATPEEKAKLVRYVGWGAFAQPMFSPSYRDKSWDAERLQLKELLTDEEYDAARRSTQNAHYTSAPVVWGMWGAMEQLGFKGGRVLEPAVGSGNFIGLIPDKVRASTAWTASELDPITGGIAKLLYAGADVNVMGFQDLKRPDDYFDAAISNVPFGDIPIRDERYGKPWLNVHDYFFVKALDKVRPGGVVAFITSRYTMDKIEGRARRLIAERADLIGAIRLPGGRKGAFAGNAGTEVVTDILFLRKRAEGEAAHPDAAKWDELAEIKDGEGQANINAYFVANPQMVLGRHAFAGSMYRADDYTVEPTADTEGQNLGIAIENAAKSFPETMRMLDRQAAVKEAPTVEMEDPTATKEGGFFIQKGQLLRRVQGVGQPSKLNKADEARVRALIPMRDLVNRLMASQATGETEGNDKVRAELKKLYAAFTKEWGPINRQIRTAVKTKDGKERIQVRRPNFKPFMADPDAYKLAAIEVYDPDADRAKPAAIFERDVVSAPLERVIRTPSDALAASFDERGRLDIGYVAQALDMDIEEAAAALGDLAFQNPAGDVWESSEEYLSGDVVTKLEDAEAAVKDDARFERNVEALRKVQPEKLTYVDIRAQMGANWVPQDVYEKFITDELGANKAELSYNKFAAQWNAKVPYASPAAVAKYATDRVSMQEVLNAALNNGRITVYDRHSDGSSTVNGEATEQANQRVGVMKDAFSGDPETGVEGWVWGDEGRRARLEALYNRKFNSTVQRRYDGSHLTLPGLATSIAIDKNGVPIPFELRPHQKNAVWRALNRGNTLFAHVVGAGKTFTMIASGMEMRRLGLARKPMYAVPNHMLEQFSREFLQAYPGANVLIAQKEETSKDNRKAFVAKAAAGNWDAIIITHSAFGRIPVSAQVQKEYFSREIEDLEMAIADVLAAEGKKSRTVKQMESAKEKLEAKLADLIKAEKKDEGVTFEEMGVDHLFVDEAHLFKNLMFATKMGRIKGVSNSASQRASDLYMKARWLEKTRPGRGLTFATGTPISNTVAEMFTMQRYLQMDRLERLGLDRFDAWASAFGATKEEIEMAPDGRSFRPVVSFSKFVNIPELVSIYSEVADTQTADMLKLPRPELAVQADGKRGITIVKAQLSDTETNLIDQFVARAEALKGGKIDPKIDNMLKVVTDGRKVAVDGRLYDVNLPFNPNGKVAKAVENIARIYHEGSHPGLAQIVFLDMGVPQSRKAAQKEAAQDDTETEINEDPDADLGIDLAALDVRMNLYADMRDRLIAAGVKPNEIAFIHDAKDDEAKAALFAKVRSGDIRVMFGSTGKMGVGTNVQKLLVAMHHIDAPYKPAEVEQRDGRILRQGNENSEVSIYRYITERSFDAFMWQALDRKAGFIGQLVSGAKGVRTSEDVDNPLPEAAEMKAAASGDPRILLLAELNRKVNVLQTQRRAYESARSRLMGEKHRLTGEVKGFETRKEAADAVVAPLEDVSGDKFKIDLSPLGEGVITKRDDVGPAIKRFFLKHRDSYSNDGKWVKLGKFAGFELQAFVARRWMESDWGVYVRPVIRSEGVEFAARSPVMVLPDADLGGFAQRLENIARDIAGYPAHLEGQLEAYRKALEKVSSEESKGSWPREEEYQQTTKQLAELKKAMAPPEQKPPQPLTEADQSTNAPRGWGEVEPGEDLRAKLSAQEARRLDRILRGIVHQVAGEHHVKIERPAIALNDDAQANINSGGSGELGKEIGGSHQIIGQMDESGNAIMGWSVIVISRNLSVDNQVSTAFHESFHSLQSMGAITAREQALLRAEAPRLRVYLQQQMGHYWNVPALSQKEVEAYAFERYAMATVSGGDPGTMFHIGVRRLFARLLATLYRIGNWAQGRGFQTAEDVFRKAYTGEIAARREGRDWVAQRTLGAPVYRLGETNQSFSPEAARDIERRNAEAGLTRPERAPVEASFEAPKETWLDRVRRTMQDEFAYLGKIQGAIEKAGGVTLSDALNALRAVELFPGRAAEAVVDFYEGPVKDLATAMAHAKVSADELGKFLLAMHAEERNDVIAERNPEMPDAGSGMATEAARAYLEERRQDGTYDALLSLAQRVWNMVEFDRQNRHDAGLITDETYEAWVNAYEHYVPLRNFAEMSEDEADDSDLGRTGKGFDVRGPEAMAALGRQSVSANPLHNVIQQVQEGIIRAEKNRAGQALLRLARANKHPELWQIERRPTRKVYDERSGLVKRVLDRGEMMGPNVIVVKNGGLPVRITLMHPGLAEAYKKLGVTGFGPVVSWFARFNRFFAQLQTSKNPQFFIRNFLRDVQEAGFTALAEKPAVAASFGKTLLPTMFTVIKAQTAPNSLTAEERDMFDEWRRFGGKITYGAFLDLKEIAKDIEHRINDAALDKPTRIARQYARPLKWIEGLNEIMESTTRFAIYKAARENGYSRDAAASLAREATVNFTRRGKVSPWINAFWVFFNANVQGNYKLIQMMVPSKMDTPGRRLMKRRAAMFYGSLVPMGFMITLWNLAMAGSDDDEKREQRSNYRAIPDWKRQQSIILFYGHGREDYVAIPGAFGMRIPYYLGEELAMVMSGQVKPWKAAANVLANTLNAFNPTGEGSLLNKLAPTMVDPIVDLTVNRDWRGRRIYPDEERYTRGVPKSEQYGRGTNEAAIAAARTINRMTGGDRTVPGLADFYPEAIEYAVKWAGGGLGRFVTDGVQGFMNYAEGVPTPVERIPVLRDFMPTSKVGTEQSLYYDARSDAEAVYNRFNAVKKALEKEPNDPELKKRMLEIAREVGARRGANGDWTWAGTPHKLFTKADAEIKDIRDQIDDIRRDRSASASARDAQIRRLEQTMVEIMKTTRRNATERMKRLQPAG